MTARYFLAVLLLLGLSFAPVFAREVGGESNVLRLSKLYERSFQAGEDSPYAKRLEDERLLLREAFLGELAELVRPKEADDSLDIEKALDRQRSTVSSLRERLKEGEVDLELLIKEEELYKEALRIGTGAVGLLMTKSYPELLARKLILEERVSAFLQVLSSQEERLQKLQVDQRLKDFELLWSALWYVVIFIIVFSLERFIREKVLLRIPSRRFRYALTKGFTTVVYFSLAFWFIQDIFTNYPGVLAAFALVGAAAVVCLQDLIKGAMGWILHKNSFAIGQRVSIGNFTGDVVDMGMFHTTLLTSSSSHTADPAHVGKVTKVPNALLLTQPIVNENSTSDFLRVELPVTVPSAKHSRRAKEVLEKILEEEVQEFVREASSQAHERMRGFPYSRELRPPSYVAMEICDDGVLFTLCFPAPIGERRAVVTMITEKILERFAQENIPLQNMSSSYLPEHESLR